MIGHWWLCGRKWPSPLLPKRKLGLPNIDGPQDLKFSLPIAKRYKKIWSPSKKIFLGSGSTVYTMDNKDTNTDCLKVVRVGGQKWKIVEITVRISFFVWVSYSLLLIQGVFKSHLKKLPPPKVPVPTKYPNLT